MTPEKLTAGLAVAHLYRRYPAPEFFCVHEPLIGQSGPNNTDRRADFMALRMWGGVSRAPLGFEIKVSRADFLQEVGDPDKRRPLEECCSACYFVAPPGLFRVDELPEGWGWIQLTAGGLIRKKEARHRAMECPSWLLAVLMKRLLDDRWHDRARRPVVVDVTPELFKFAGLEVTPNQLLGEARKIWKHELDAARADGRRQEREDRNHYGVEESKSVNAFIQVIAKVTGLSHWEASNPERLATALAAGFNKDHGRVEKGLDRSVQKAEGALNNISRLVDDLKSIQADLGKEAANA